MRTSSIRPSHPEAASLEPCPMRRNAVLEIDEPPFDVHDGISSTPLMNNRGAWLAFHVATICCQLVVCWFEELSSALLAASSPAPLPNPTLITFVPPPPAPAASYRKVIPVSLPLGALPIINPLSVFMTSDFTHTDKLASV